MPHDSLPSFHAGRKWSAGFHVVLSSLALLALMVMLNYLAFRHPHRLQLAEESQHELSPLTRRLLASLTNKVNVIVFFDRREPLYEAVTDLLAEYKALTPQIEVEHVDSRLSPGRAELVQAQYRLTSTEGARVVFHANGRTQVVFERELSELDYSEFMTKREARRTAFRGEQLFTSAIYTLIDPAPRRAFFLQGHGEHDPLNLDQHDGYGRFVQVLQESNFEVYALKSLVTDDVPPDSLLVIAGPERLLQSTELERIEKFLNQGGRLFVLFNVLAMDKRTGLERILANWGVDVGNNFIKDKLQSQAVEQGGSLITDRFGNHQIVSPLGGARIQLNAPRSVSAKASAPSGADAPKVTELLFSSEKSEAVRADGKAERSGKISLAAAVEKGSIQGVSADRGVTRIVVVGDSLFLDNSLMDREANRDFGNLAVSWLVNRDLLLEGIGPRAVREFKITVTAEQLQRLRWLFLGVFPGGVLLLGCLVWLRRRF